MKLSHTTLPLLEVSVRSNKNTNLIYIILTIIISIPDIVFIILDDVLAPGQGMAEGYKRLLGQ